MRENNFNISIERGVNMRIKYLLLCVLLSFGACDKTSTKSSASLEEKIQKVQKIIDEKNLPFKVIEIADVGHSLDLVVLESQNGTQDVLLSTSDNEVLMLLDGIAYADKETIDKIVSKQENATKVSKQIVDSTLKEVLQSHKDRVIHFSAKSPTDKQLIIISDPSCMYCAKELSELDERLEQYNVDMYIVGLLGLDSIKRASYIMEHKSDDEAKNKALLQNAYDKNFNVGEGKESLVKGVTEFTEILANSGVRSVPHIIEVE